MYERLSAAYNLQVFAELYGCKDPKGQVEKYLRLLDLWDRRDTEAGTFSKGMKQKLAIARALLHEPPVVFLDEPTAALDPESAKTVRDFIETLRGQGRTIFLCTHNLDEAERLCDRIGVFKQRLIAVDTPDALRQKLFGRQTVVQLAPGSDVQPAGGRRWHACPASSKSRPCGGRTAAGPQLVISLGEPAQQNPAIVRALVEAGACDRVRERGAAFARRRLPEPDSHRRGREGAPEGGAEMNAIGTIIQKEWAEVRRNKLVLSVVIFIPLLMTAIPLVMMGIMGRVGVSQGDLEEMSAMLKNPLFQGLDPVEAVQSMMASQLPRPVPDDAAHGAGDDRRVQHRGREGHKVAGAAAGDADQHDEAAAGQGRGRGRARDRGGVVRATSCS